MPHTNSTPYNSLLVITPLLPTPTQSVIFLIRTNV